MNRMIFAVCMLLAAYGMCETRAAAADAGKARLRAVDFGAMPDDQKDDTQAFQRLFAAAAAAKGGVTVEIAPGQYDFLPEHATRRVCFASNATQTDNPVRTIALDLSGLSDVTIQANQVRFQMHGNFSLLVAENSRNLTIEGASFDLARPTLSELNVTEVGDHFWVGKALPDTPFVLEGGVPIWVGEDWRKRANLAQRFDPRTNTTWRDTLPFGKGSSVVEQSPGELKVTMEKMPDYKVGQVITLRNTERDQVAMWFNHCKDVTLRDVAIHALPGFGVLSQFTENVNFTRVRVEPTAGSNRSLASAADIFHFSMCRGKIEIVDCLMKGAHDDAVNVHGIHLRIEQRLADNRLLVRFGHKETHGFQAFWPGDDVEFVSHLTLLATGRAKVTEATFRSDGAHELTFDRNIPADVVVGKDVIENLAWIPSVHIAGCRVERIPTRGFLLTTRGLIVVENNTFEKTRMPAILMSDDANGWFESGPVHDATIRNNTFVSCGEPVISIKPENKTDAGPVHNNIRIADNTFFLKRRGVAIKSASNVVIENNQFKLSGGTTVMIEDLIKSSAGSEPKVNGNTISASAAPG